MEAEIAAEYYMLHRFKDHFYTMEERVEVLETLAMEAGIKVKAVTDHRPIPYPSGMQVKGSPQDMANFKVLAGIMFSRAPMFKDRPGGHTQLLSMIRGLKK